MIRPNDSTIGTMLSLAEVVQSWTERQPDRLACVYLKDGLTPTDRLTYAELNKRCRAVAAYLQQRLHAGDRALVVFPPGLDFVSAFLGCLYAGVVPVPAPPPDPVRLKRTLPRLYAIAGDAEISALLTTAELQVAREAFCSQFRGSRSVDWIQLEDIDEEGETDWKRVEPSLDALAFLQYTSGSTSLPRGVMVSHRNLLHNLGCAAQVAGFTPEAISVSWLPAFHDYGLINGLLLPLFTGTPAYVIPSVAFLRRPLCWLQAMTQYRATHSGAPNFAYDYCVARTSVEQRATLDLRHWKVASCGADPIRRDTVERFIRAFEPHGFSPHALSPAYGLAEFTLVASFTHHESADRSFLDLDGGALEAGRVTRAGPGSEHVRTLVSCGYPVGGTKVVIVDPTTLRRAPADRVGEIWLSDPSVAQGYWNRPEDTWQTFHAHLSDDGDGPFLRTGDLGFLWEGRLFVCGRLKDLITIRGKNHYPQDIERTVEESHPALRKGAGVAFSIDEDGEERLVVVHELDTGARAPDLAGVADAVREAVADEHDVQASHIVLVKPGHVPKTTSGKLQRRACRQAYLSGELPVIHRSVLPCSAFAAGEPSPGDLTDASLPEERVTRIEQHVRQCLARTLRLDPSSIERETPLGALGLDSLNSFELKHQLETALGTSVPLSALLKDASLGKLAAQLLAQGDAASTRTPPAVQGARGVMEESLSASQKAQWFLSRLAPDDPSANASVVLPISGDVDPEALRSSVQSLLDRHAILRTTYHLQNGLPIQRAGGTRPVRFEVTDASALGVEELTARLSQAAEEPFDLGRDTMLRAHVFLRSPGHRLLLVSAHHIAVDGWSLSLLVQQLREACAGAPTAGVVDQASSSPSYLDYVRWQSQMLAGPEGSRLWSYWRSRLDGPLPELRLPYVHAPSRPRARSSPIPIDLPAELSMALRTLARDHGTTLYTVLLAAFEVLLHRYTGQEDIALGSVMAGRSRPEFSRTVGNLANVLVLREHLGDDPPFRSFLHRVRETVLGAMDHQDYPFSLLVERLQPHRDPSRSPLVQVLFVLQRFRLLHERETEELMAAEGDGSSFEPFVLPQTPGQFDMILEMADVGASIAGSVQYNPAVLAARIVGQMAGHFRRLLEGIVADPERTVSSLPLLSEPERRTCLIEWNQTETGLPDSSCIQDLFQARVKRSPDAPAVVAGEDSVSYGELDQRANRLAQALRSVGVGPEVLVGICLERSIDMIVAVLAVLKAGGAYVPLDAASPGTRLAYMIEDSRCAVVLTQQRLLGRLPQSSVRVMCVDMERESLAHAPAVPPVSAVGPGNLAYVIYTSGSTGRPKGVMVEHKSVVNFAWAMREVLGLRAEDRVLQFASLSFDASVEEIFPCLASGGTLVLRTDEMLQSASAFLRACDDWRITVLDLPTSYWHDLVSHLADDRLRLPPTVRTVIIGGERASPQAVAVWRRHVGNGVRLLNTYGPTEATVTATTWQVTPSAEQEHQEAEVPIGRPLANVQAYILDQHRQPVPIGVAGELHIGGAGLARGYLNHPDLTEAQFVRDPFAKDGCSRLYRTGDYCRYRSDGAIEFLGRADHQVKLRGFRIELGEIEAALEEHPRVWQAVVLLRDGLTEGGILVAYVVPVREPGPPASELRGFLQERLPLYMIPATFVHLNAWPRTQTGKIDRAALPAPDPSASEPEQSFVAPRSPIEQTLAEIWSDVLGLPQAGVHDNFFAYGGHSLLATQVAARIHAVFQLELPLHIFFERPTIAGLAEEVEARLYEGRATSTYPPITTIPREGLLPLSFAQERIWFMQQVVPSSAAYCIPVCVRLNGVLDWNALTQSLLQLITRHAILRTTFTHVEGRPVQRIAPPAPVEPRWIDLRHLERDVREKEARRIATDQACQPFDLERGPLLRPVCIRLSEDEHLLLLTLHHIIADQWSVGVLSRELAALYEDACEGKPDQLPPLPVQYVDFAHWQRGWLRGPLLDGQLAYWTERLADLPVLSFPTDRPRPAAQTFRGAHVSLELPWHVIEQLKRLSRREGVTLYMTCLAAFFVLLGRYTGQQDIAIGTPVANRRLLFMEQLIGTFVNTLVLRVDLSGEPRFQALLRQVREAALGAYAHQDLPFERLVQELHPNRDSSLMPLVQVLFNFANHPFERVKFKGLTSSPMEIDRGASQYDISLSVDTVVTGKAFLEFNTDLFDRERMTVMLEHYRELLGSIAEDPCARIADLNMMTASERRHVVVDWNDTGRPYPQDLCFTQLFEQQVARSPHAVAARCDERTLTYQELNARANQLARYLTRRGVGPERLVGVYMDRSLDMLVALLGVMKAGAAYLPLDVDYPRARLAFMLQDSQAQAVISDSRLETPVGQSDLLRIDLDKAWGAIAREPVQDPTPVARPSNLAYVIYTSGSTGIPKGVEIEHRSLVNLLHSMLRAPGLGERDVLLSVTPISFDIAWLELYLPLLVGATVVVARKEDCVDGVRLLTRLQQSGATVMQATPATWRLLLEAGWTRSPGFTALCGGEALPRPLAEQLLGRCDAVWNLYGPTETTIWSMVEQVRREDGAVLIGRPIDNTQIFIVDSTLQPVPIGVPGELCIGGSGLARGYRARAQLTEERFVVAPFSEGERRVYRTGDVARWHPDGRIECLGRMDDQIKIRGYRVELGEIEAVLGQAEWVKDCAVVARKVAQGDERLVAYVVPKPGERLDVEGCRGWLRSRLPAYMVPPTYVSIERLPLTPNGKVDRNALRSLADREPEPRSSQAIPSTALHIQLRTIWEEVLGISGIGTRDNFFDLGGHSLLALQVFAKIEKRFGKRLPMVTLFEAPTIEQLASLLQENNWSPHWRSLVAITDSGRHPPFFAVPGIGGNVLGFLELARRLGPDQPFYGLQSRGLDGREEPLTRIEDIAAHFVDEIRTVQPSGPYYLGGTCIGGIVAYAMAQRLHAQGEKVALLVLMETWPPHSLRPPGYHIPSFMRPLGFLLSGAARYGRTLLRSRPREWGTNVAKGLRLVSEMVAHRDVYRGDRSVLFRDKVSEANLKAAGSYVLMPFPGRIELIMASKRPVVSAGDSRLTWCELALGGSSVEDIPVRTSGELFVKPHVEMLAAKLQTLIARARGQA